MSFDNGRLPRENDLRIILDAMEGMGWREYLNLFGSNFSAWEKYGDKMVESLKNGSLVLVWVRDPPEQPTVEE